jgi:hypothetical protein
MTRGRPPAPETQHQRDLAGYLAERGVGARGIARIVGWSVGHAQRFLRPPQNRSDRCIKIPPRSPHA